MYLILYGAVAVIISTLIACWIIFSSFRILKIAGPSKNLNNHLKLIFYVEIPYCCVFNAIYFLGLTKLDCKLTALLSQISLVSLTHFHATFLTLMTVTNFYTKREYMRRYISVLSVVIFSLVPLYYNLRQLAPHNTYCLCSGNFQACKHIPLSNKWALAVFFPFCIFIYLCMAFYLIILEKRLHRKQLLSDPQKPKCYIGLPFAVCCIYSLDTTFRKFVLLKIMPLLYFGWPSIVYDILTPLYNFSDTLLFPIVFLICNRHLLFKRGQVIQPYPIVE
jgi:hypothetical protein